MTNLDSILKSKDIFSSTKVYVVKALVFPVVMHGCEIWSIKKAECWRIDAFELWCWTVESPLESKEIKSVNPKGNQPWILIGRTDAEAEVPILWWPDAKSWLFGKDPDSGKDWGQAEKGATEDEMVGWHHFSMDMNLIELQEIVKDRKPGMLQSLSSESVRHNWATEQQQQYMKLKKKVPDKSICRDGIEKQTQRTNGWTHGW